MKHLIICLFLLVSISFTKANNIQITNLSRVVNTSTKIKFDLSWENSWRSTAIGNLDAAYLFFKYKTTSGEWKAINLDAVTILPVGYDYQTTYNYNALPYGVFIYRSAPGFGNVNLTNIELFGNFTLAQPSFGGTGEIRAFAVEMVHQPVGVNYFFYGDGFSTNSYPVQALSFGNNPAIIQDPLANPNSQTLPFQTLDFFCMKYELSQGGYRDFLNTLTYAQQVNHIVPLPTAAAGTAALYNANRNSIKIKTPGIAPNLPAVFGCDANGNGIYDEADDGEWVACNYVNWVDHAAYLAWASLRPMSELEYELAARGPNIPKPGEYAWGNTNLFNSSTLGGPFYNTTNANQASETITNTSTSPIGNAMYSNTNSNSGPTRNGVFASTATNRTSSGGGYYGAMELSGNLWERVITTAKLPTYYLSEQLFSPNLSQEGFATLAANGIGWPGYSTVGVPVSNPQRSEVRGAVNALGLIYRGGAWNSTPDKLRISDRSGLLVADPNTDRSLMGAVGIRGCTRVIISY
jgi:formylglycine-generating enzyme required for sulfatase activity